MEETPVVELAQSAPAAAEVEFEIPEAVIEPEATLEVTPEAAPEATVEPEPLEIAPEPEAIEVAPELELAVPEASAEPEAEIALDPAFEIIEEAAASVPASEPEPATASNVEFELELTPEPATAAGKNGAATTEDFLSELAAEIDDLETPAAIAPKAAAPVHTPAPPPPPPVREVAGRGSIGEHPAGRTGACPCDRPRKL